MTYEEVLQFVSAHGDRRSDRTGTGTISFFNPPQIRYDLSQGFPLITSKKMHLKSIVHELLWFLSGSTNNNDLKKHGVSIWDKWAADNGELGPIYGAQFHRGDQLNKTIQQLKENPDSRRHVITLWNPEDLEKQALPCCHGTVIQFYVESGELSLSMYQRSADMFLGVPFNIASYALFLEIVAQVCGYKAKQLILTLGDAHIYSNHVEQVREQLSRDASKYAFPRLELNSLCQRVADFTYDDIRVWGYGSYPAIKGAVSK